MNLTPFDGQDVIKTTIAVTNAGDGLSDTMKVEPKEFHLGETVYVVLECEVSKVRFEPIKDTDALSRVHVLRAGNATIVEADLVKPMVDAMAERVLEAKEAEQGIRRLPMDQRSLAMEHELGGHFDGLVEGCPPCDEEAAAVEAEDMAARDALHDARIANAPETAEPEADAEA